METVLEIVKEIYKLNKVLKAKIKKLKEQLDKVKV